MAIPTGSGSERLKRASLVAGTGWREILSGTNLHIYTIVSLVFSSASASTGGIGIQANDGSNDITLVSWSGTNVGGYGTFIFNDKIVLEEDDDLDVYSAVSGAWWLSYIDQNWID